MKVERFPYKKTGFFSDLVLDYLAQKDELRKFYSYFPSTDAFEKAIELKQKENIDREVLVKVLEEQYKHLEDVPEAVQENIALLKESNCYTITTGHQLCLFGGPLFVVLKLISTMKLAKHLSEEYDDYNFVPVFWMATEDHDFEEINHAYLFNKKVEWKQEQGGAVGELPLDSLDDALEKLEEILGTNGYADEVRKWIEGAYNKQANLADATRCFFNGLFGKEGLVILDANHKELKKQFAPFMQKELQEQCTIEYVQPATTRLDGPYKTLVSPRDINLFYLQEGSRERIEKNDDRQYKVLNTDKAFNKEEILEELENHPERFSPNVILRTLYQETILPNLAYIGGPGELSYWLQFKGLFVEEERFFPILVLRNSIVWLDDYSTKKMDKLGIAVEDLFQDRHALTKKLVKQKSDNELSLKEETEAIKKVLKQVHEKAEDIDQSLEQTVKASEMRILNELEKVEGKLVKAEKQNMDTIVQQIENIYDRLFPENALAERQESFIAYYLKHGPEFLKALQEHLQPLEPSLTVFEEK